MVLTVTVADMEQPVEAKEGRGDDDPKAESMQMSTAMNKCSRANLTQHSTARKQWRISLWSVQSCRHDRNTFSASPYQPASDRKPPRTERHQYRRGDRQRSPSIKPKLKLASIGLWVRNLR